MRGDDNVFDLPFLTLCSSLPTPTYRGEAVHSTMPSIVPLNASADTTALAGSLATGNDSREWIDGYPCVRHSDSSSSGKKKPQACGLGLEERTSEGI
jgi:hypothetical protein